MKIGVNAPYFFDLIPDGKKIHIRRFIVSFGMRLPPARQKG